jgi:hypothetical protein
MAMENRAMAAVARSPDLATAPTEGLQTRHWRETCGPANGEGEWLCDQQVRQQTVQ